jgi:hypothetical protein
MTTANVRSRFKATGIYPFDPSAIPDLAFKLSEIASAVETQSAQEGDEDRVDTCGVIDVDADPATGNDKADTDT